MAGTRNHQERSRKPPMRGGAAAVVGGGSVRVREPRSRQPRSRCARAGRMITGHYDRLLLPEAAEVIMQVIIRPCRIPIDWLKTPETINDVFQNQPARVRLIILT